MPIYEFYCGKCHRVYDFFSRTVNTEKVPDCPRCGKTRLTREISLFAALSGGRKMAGDSAEDVFDEAKMERAMSLLAGEAEKMSDVNPRQAAMLMRRLTEAAGMAPGARMEEALDRLESGEDPERIDEELGDIIDDEELFISGSKIVRSGRKERPIKDERLYEL